jgi:hypothetical protein
MDFTTLKIAGNDAIRLLNDYRSQYSATGQYPFLIGDAEELDRIKVRILPQSSKRLSESEPKSGLGGVAEKATKMAFLRRIYWATGRVRFGRKDQSAFTRTC